MAFKPVVISQLGVPLGGVACGDMSIAMAWFIASEGKVDFRHRRPNVPRVVRELAAPLRLPEGGTFPDELQRAFEGAADRFARQELRAPRMRKMWSASFDDVLVPAMRDRRRSAIVGLWYNVINRLVPEISGQPGLKTWHWVTITNLRSVPRSKLSYPVRDGQDPAERVEAVTLLDPLADGRRPGIWKGPATVEIAVIRLAAGRVGKKKDGRGTPIGEGRVLGGIFGRARPLNQPGPASEPATVPHGTPEPVDPCADLRLRLARSNGLLALYQARLEEVGDLAGELIDPEIEDGTGAPDEIGEAGIVDDQTGEEG